MSFATNSIRNGEQMELVGEASVSAQVSWSDSVVVGIVWLLLFFLYFSRSAQVLRSTLR